MFRLFSSRCGHGASPAPRAVRSPTAQFIIVSVLRLFPSRLVSPSRASTEPTAQFSYPLVVTVGGRIRSCYQPMTYQQCLMSATGVNINISIRGVQKIDFLWLRNFGANFRKKIYIYIYIYLRLFLKYGAKIFSQKKVMMVQS